MKEFPIEDYILNYTSPVNKLMAELERETYLKTMFPRMLSGHLQGKFLEFISQMIKPEKILEIGTFTGYSAICLSKGLVEGGILHTIEINPELSIISSDFFKKASVDKKIKQHIGNALEIIPTINEKFDLVFLDADKENYLNYYHLFIENVKKGGFILTDNVLWSEKVLLPEERMDKETAGIVQFNKYIRDDKQVEQMIVPLRDGIMLTRKM
ncbi:MAG: O-methyltransferase [Bacteroidales bacterium]|nr:O-methyltransferase [Bacteroidales bacterium]